jgi:hypothetical protein
LVDEHFPHLDFNEYERIRELFVYLNKAKPYLINKEKSHFKQLFEYCSWYLKVNDINTIIQILFKEAWSERDILGTYTYSSHRIELYYLPLIIFSKITGISLEYAFVVILAHELSHAYHHVGKDNDGIIWNDMPIANTKIKEGLAQYFTHLFVEDQKLIYPELEIAFKKILSYQDGPYIVHKNWLPFKKEAVKTAMVMLRAGNQKTFEEFEKEIEFMNKKLKYK